VAEKVSEKYIYEILHYVVLYFIFASYFQNVTGRISQTVFKGKEKYF
jgi:hypothetical protein